jgi:AcrR family transcriptional regulator
VTADAAHGQPVVTGARRDQQRSGADRSTDRQVREAILQAAEVLLARQRFAAITVADIIAEAGVARASFYFYFESKYAVLAELARRAVSSGHLAADPWVHHGSDEDPRAALRHGVLDGARVWQAHAPVLRAVVENWRDDPQLSTLWVELIGTYAHAAGSRIDADRAAGIALPARTDSHHLASALSWLAERLYYLAATDVAPFADQQVLVDTLTEIWTAVIYGPASTPPRGSRTKPSPQPPPPAL